jgi:hypothetical protein
MADFSQTVSNTVSLYIFDVPSLWGVMIWGTDPWTQITEGLPVIYSKVVSESQVSTSTVDHIATFNITKSNSVALTDSYDHIGNFRITKLGTITTTEDTFQENLYQEGWEYVFTHPSVNAEDRPNTIWTEV